jgi:uncharacterized protein (DUF885 family)
VRDGLAVEAALARRFPVGGVGATPDPYVLTPRSGAFQQADGLSKAAQPRAGGLEALARDIDGQTERLRADAGAGVLPPAAVLEATTKAVAEAAARAGAVPALQAALERQAAALAALSGQAKPGDGVWRFMGGDEYYALVLRHALGQAIDPHEAHRRALDEARALQARADLLLRAQGLTQGGVGERLRALARDPRFLYPDDSAGRDRAVAEMNARLTAVRLELPRAFGDLPIPRAEVRRMSPADAAKARAGYRELPGVGGVGAYYVDLSRIRGRPSWTLPSVAHHELLPGHLLQLPLQEAAGPHPLRVRYASAYAEAWATYAERLASELDAYRGDPLGEIGALQWRLFRMARVVADTGVHAERWSRERAIATVRELQGDSIAFITIEADVDRILLGPGQVAAQGLGALAFAQLRGPATGPGAAAFHRAVLVGGPWPFGLLPQVAGAAA